MTLVRQRLQVRQNYDLEQQLCSNEAQRQALINPGMKLLMPKKPALWGKGGTIAFIKSQEYWFHKHRNLFTFDKKADERWEIVKLSCREMKFTASVYS